MSNFRVTHRRIHPFHRLLRPPNRTTTSSLPNSRPFTYNSQLLLVASNTFPRPQLPYLASPTTHPLARGRWNASRLLTTETKDYIKTSVWNGIKWTAMIYLVIGGCMSIAFAIKFEVLERRFPTPSEWSWYSQHYFHTAEEQKDGEIQRDGFIDNGAAGNNHSLVIERLEDSSIDGKGVTAQDESNPLTAPGFGPTGLDISSKSEPWKRNYLHSLLAIASAAEYMEGWLLDTKNNVYAPPEYVKGPSNPRPKPLPKGAPIPNEKNCEPAFEIPDHYYHKAMTTLGLSNSQRIEAALAYSVYLDYKKRFGDADEVLTWAMDLACSVLDEPSAMVDRSTGIVKPNARPTENVLQTSTARAVHEASTGNPGIALPIFLSVLRARDSAPLLRPPVAIDPPKKTFWESIPPLISQPFPPAPRSGDEPVIQDPTIPCEISSLKTYIGEILFALSPSHRTMGLNWTREAIDEARRVWADHNASKATREKCYQCAEVGLNNLFNMTALLASEEKQKQWAKRNSGWREWVGYKTSEELLDEEPGKWELENNEVSRRKRNMQMEKMKRNLGRP